MLGFNCMDYDLIMKAIVKILMASSFVFAITSAVLTAFSGKGKKDRAYLLRSAWELLCASLITKFTFLAIILGTFLLTDISDENMYFFRQICLSYFILSVTILLATIISKYVYCMEKTNSSENIGGVYSIMKFVSVMQISGFYLLSLVFEV